ncbi:MAG: hypothetical protein WCT11_03455 [Candidatus Magasanikbacteria bacterium]|jgi:hypothetical protein
MFRNETEYIMTDAQCEKLVNNCSHARSSYDEYEMNAEARNRNRFP